ncbi:uncharacterized protein LOC143282305 [Babylonia areolata]|uniref:uncharacterized protein LOC143282305 n=1 Tax=Babylonia areolata TaxID=304850 RepID=UPI003FD1428B
MAAVAAYLFISSLWYSRFFLGKPWMDATFPNRRHETISETGAVAIALTLVSSAGMAVVLHVILVDLFQVETVVDVVKFAAALSCLSTLMDSSHQIFSKRSFTTYLIDHGFDAISLVTMSTCVFYLR